MATLATTATSGGSPVSPDGLLEMRPAEDAARSVARSAQTAPHHVLPALLPEDSRARYSELETARIAAITSPHPR